MKVRFYHWYNHVLMTLLTMLGFGSCNSIGEDEYGVIPVEYGTPYTDFVIKGQVTDEDDVPIDGAKAVLKEIPEDHPEYVYGIDSTTTDSSGKFQMTTRFYLGCRDIKLVVGDTKGEYINDTIAIDDMERQQTAQGHGWSEGKFEVQPVVKLKKRL